MHVNILNLINYFDDVYLYEDDQDVEVQEEIENFRFKEIRSKLIEEIITINERGYISGNDIDIFDETCFPEKEMYKRSVDLLNELFIKVNDTIRSDFKKEVKNTMSSIIHEMQYNTMRSKLLKLRNHIIETTKIEEGKCILSRSNIDTILKYKINTIEKLESFILIFHDYNSQQKEYIEQIIEILNSKT